MLLPFLLLFRQGGLSISHDDIQAVLRKKKSPVCMQTRCKLMWALEEKTVVEREAEGGWY